MKRSLAALWLCLARSWGPMIGAHNQIPNGINDPTDEMALRIEAPGRSYGFVALERTADDPAGAASARTRELYELVTKLWSVTLKSKK